MNDTPHLMGQPIWTGNGLLAEENRTRYQAQSVLHSLIPYYLPTLAEARDILAWRARASQVCGSQTWQVATGTGAGNEYTVLHTSH